MVLGEPTVPSTWISSLVLQLYHSNKQQVLKKRAYMIHTIFSEGTKIQQVKQRLC